MKKILIMLISLIAGITITWCDFTNWLSKNDVFEKKQECTKYKDSMLKDWIEINQDWMNRTWDPYKLNVEEIFYNQNENSCFYVLSVSKFVDMVVGNKYTDYILLNKYVYNYLSKEEVLSTTNLSEEQFNISLKELKWEVEVK